MADGSESTMTLDQPVPGTLVDGLKSFAGDHGGARAGIEYVGRRAELADLEADARLLIAPLAASGVAAEPAVWDDPGVDWTSYDLAVLRSAWDYPARRAEFVAWAGRVPALANPADVVAWNTD